MPSPATESSPAWTDEQLRRDPHAAPDKADRVRRMFAAIAPSYDLNNRVHSFGRDQAWRRATVRLAGLTSGDRVLDVACGTGDLALAFARAGAAEVVGADFTPEMLAVARRRSAKGADAVTWLEADAQALPFEDASFDVVSIAFGIRNVQDSARALCEFRRVLRPGGRVVVLEFSRPRLAPIAWVNDVYMRVVMPITATLVSGDRSGAYRYLPRSVTTFPTRDAFAQMLREAGFTLVTQKPMTFGVAVGYRGVVPDSE